VSEHSGDPTPPLQRPSDQFDGQPGQDAGEVTVPLPWRRHTGGSARRAWVAAVVAVCLVAIAAVAVLVIHLQSTGGDDQEGSRAASTASSTAGNRSSSSAAQPVTTPTHSSVRYKKVRKLCQTANLTALERRFGPRRGTKSVERTSTSGSVTTMTCSVGIGSRGDGVLMQAAVFAGGTSRTVYEGLRRVDDERFKVSNVPNLGTDAYTYTNPELGTFVVAYDNNLYITVAFVPVGRAPGDDGNLPNVLAEACRQTMANLAA
jgi:hypothetical protein